MSRALFETYHRWRKRRTVGECCCSVDCSTSKVLCIVLLCSTARVDLQEGQQQGLFT